MNCLRITRTTLLACGILVACCLARRAESYPPAPHHVIHGMVRDEYGEALSMATAQVLLETTNGVAIACGISPDIAPGENYRLTVPMDSLTALDLYKTTALHSAVPFRLKVKIGATVYLPLEMAGNLASLGKPAGDTLMNLTLGVDSDGDGLPDAWEYLLIQMLGGGLTLADINPNGDNDGDGLSNYQEYLASTYAWDPDDGPSDGLRLGFIRRSGQGPVVQFYGIAGRTYSVHGTTNLSTWTTMSVRVPPGDVNATPTQQYLNPVSQILELEVLLPAPQPQAMFFRVRVN